VADIGCGVGILMQRLNDEKGCNVFGVDVSEVAIGTLREKGMDGIAAIIPPIPLPSNYFDVVIATELLEHLNRPEKALKEMVRVSKPGGSVIITVPDNALGPTTERDHVGKFKEEKILNLFKKVKRIKETKLLRVKEKDEGFYRLIVKGEKCQGLV